jgi:hypothetical protein
MADLPVVELIAVNVYETLASVTVANGYNYNLDVERDKATPPTPKHLKCIVYQGDPTEVDGTAHAHKGWMQPFIVVVFIRPLKDDDTSLDTYCNIAFADMQKAIMVDAHRGGLAHDTYVRPPVGFADLDNEDQGFVFVCDVLYRTLIDNPFVNG